MQPRISHSKFVQEHKFAGIGKTEDIGGKDEAGTYKGNFDR